MLEVTIGWPEAKGFIDSGLPFRAARANGAYRIYVFDSEHLSWVCVLPLDASAYKTDFEDNYLMLPKKDVVSSTQTRYERTDIDLKLARGRCTIQADGNGGGYGELLVVAPSTREAGGGYLMLDSFDPDDYVKVYIEDTNRMIAWGLAFAMDSNCTAPLDDAVVAGAGVLPAPFNKAFPNYPIIKSYTDDEQPAEEFKGWFFWPLALGGTKEAFGEVEIEPIGFYGELPGQFFVKMVVVRPNVATGIARGCVFWGSTDS